MYLLPRLPYLLSTLDPSFSLSFFGWPASVAATPYGKKKKGESCHAAGILDVLLATLTQLASTPRQRRKARPSASLRTPS